MPQSSTPILEPPPQGNSSQINQTLPLLEARNVHRILGSHDTATRVLNGVNLSIHPGEYVSIVGASGSGKSTLLYLLGGLDRPSKLDPNGQPINPPSAIFMQGQNTADLNDKQLALLRNRMVGCVLQFHFLLKEFTAQENVALPMFKLKRLSRDDAMHRSAELLKRLGLAEKLKRRANKLSGGEQQRVAIARALANEPSVILADEPTGNLDRRNGELISDIFHELNAAGQTIVMVTHDLAFAKRAPRRITMEDGQIADDEKTYRDHAPNTR
jgi:lipoprotein-releasing system ATP-binding protein